DKRDDERHVRGLAPDGVEGQDAPLFEEAYGENQVKDIAEGQDDETGAQYDGRVATGHPEKPEEQGEQEEIDQQLVTELEPEERGRPLDGRMPAREGPAHADEQRSEQKDRGPHVLVEGQPDQGCEE